MTAIPRDIVAARAGVATASAEMDRHLGRLEDIARNMVATLPARRRREPGGRLHAIVRTNLTAAAEADVHRAARALGISVSEFGRRALAQAAAAINQCPDVSNADVSDAAGGPTPAALFVPRNRGPRRRGQTDEGGRA